MEKNSQEKPFTLTSGIAPLRDNRFRYLWASSAFFFSGYWAQTVVLGWLAFELTNSEFAVASFTAARFSTILVRPIGGILADRIDRLKTLRTSVIITLVIGLVIAGMATFGHLNYWLVVLVGFIGGLTQAPLMPVRFTLMMDIVGKQHLSSANALNMAAMFGSRIIAPAGAGWIISSWGPDWALWYSAAWFLPAWLLLLFPITGITRMTNSVNGRLLSDLIEGFSIAIHNRAIGAVLLATIAANVLAFPILQAFLPVFAEEILNVGASGLGLLVSMNGLGALIGCLLISTMGDFSGKGKLYLSGTISFGLLLAIFGYVDQMSLAIIIIFMAGMASSGFGVMQSTLMLLLSPEEARGRVMGVLMLSIGTQPVALLIQGVLANTFGVSFTTIACGILLSISVLLIAWRSPELRKEI